MEINLVVRREQEIGPSGIMRVFEYLTGEDGWSTSPIDAWCYASITAFEHAEDFGGTVFLRLPLGRELAVELSDFWVGEVDFLR